LSTETANSVEIQRFDLLVRWKSVVTPFEQSSLLRVLPEQGYIVSQGATEPPPFGGRLEATGSIARKGDLRLILDASRPGLQLSGVDVIDTVSEFERLEDILRDDVHFDSQNDARFYELDTQVIVQASDSPIGTFKALAGLVSIAEAVGNVLGHSTVPYGFRFGRGDSLPSSLEWQELLIEPSLRSPESLYFGILVFRRPDWETVKDVAIRATQIFEELPLTLATL